VAGRHPAARRAVPRDTDTDNRTTLYFFVTPHILRDKDFADLAEISYKKKLEAAESIGAERVRVIDPRFGATEKRASTSRASTCRSTAAGPRRDDARRWSGIDPVQAHEDDDPRRRNRA
jgi:hypothetical protein